MSDNDIYLSPELTEEILHRKHEAISHPEDLTSAEDFLSELEQDPKMKEHIEEAQLLFNPPAKIALHITTLTLTERGLKKNFRVTRKGRTYHV